MNLHRLQAFFILPFRGDIEGFSATGIIPGDSWETTITMSYESSLIQGSEMRALIKTLNLRQCTVVKVDTFLPFEGALNEAMQWATTRTSEIMNNRILSRFNHFLLHVKYYDPRVFTTGVFRTVCDIDLLISEILLEGTSLRIRGSSSFVGTVNTIFKIGAGNQIVGNVLPKIDLSQKLPREWTIITRAVDLVNHGYYFESFIVVFALFDELVQSFVKTRLPNLSSEEANGLLRKIESKRLSTYLGPFLRICLGASPLDDKSFVDNLNWLNERRNKMLHESENCTRDNSIKALNIVMDFLEFFNQYGANYSLPKNLEFWS